jgi:hypothetical protein
LYQRGTGRPKMSEIRQAAMQTLRHKMVESTQRFHGKDPAMILDAMVETYADAALSGMLMVNDDMDQLRDYAVEDPDIEAVLIVTKQDIATYYQLDDDE